MARPRSEDKRNAILSAAIETLAELGVRASTSKIAKVAGVAEGTYLPILVIKKNCLISYIFRSRLSYVRS